MATGMQPSPLVAPHWSIPSPITSPFCHLFAMLIATAFSSLWFLNISLSWKTFRCFPIWRVYVCQGKNSKHIVFDCFKLKITSSCSFLSSSSLQWSWAAIVWQWWACSYHTQDNKTILSNLRIFKNTKKKKLKSGYHLRKAGRQRYFQKERKDSSKAFHALIKQAFISERFAMPPEADQQLFSLLLWVLGKETTPELY